MGTLFRQALTNVIKAFCSEVEKAGYYVGVYVSLSWLSFSLYNSAPLPFSPSIVAAAGNFKHTAHGFDRIFPAKALDHPVFQLHLLLLYICPLIYGNQP